MRPDRYVTNWLHNTAARFLLSGLAMLSGWGCDSRSDTPQKYRKMLVLVSGDTAGWIRPCGCASNQSGGLLRRGSLVAAAKREADVIVLDAGGAASGTEAYQRAKFEAILQGELLMGLAAHNIGASEARLGAAALKEIAQRWQIPFVSANLRDEHGEPVAPDKQVIVRGAQRIAVIGVISPTLAGAPYQVSDPAEAVLKSLSNSAEPFDTVIVLAYLTEDELRKLAATTPEADLVIGGPTGQSIVPARTGPTLFASATNKGKFIAWLERPRPAETQWSGKIVEVSADLKDDPGQTQNLQSFYQRLRELDFSADQTGFVDALTDVPRDYRVAGSASCQDCHEAETAVWKSSLHAHAWQTLSDQLSEVDAFCQQCHTTGYGWAGGFASIAGSSQHTSVGCEDCHGPSQAHVADATVRTPLDASEQCQRCHDLENSPQFNYDIYWPKVAHGAGIPAVSTDEQEANHANESQ